jgi:hypothetical protein
MRMVLIEYKCPCLEAVWVQVHSFRITVQQMWLLLRKTNPSFRRKGGPISKHINGLGTETNFVMDPTGARKQECLCPRKAAAIYYYAMIVIPRTSRL